MADIPIDFNEEALMGMIKAEAEAALTESLKVVENECKNTCPIDQGQLRDSVHIEGPVWLAPLYAEGRVVAGSKDIPQAFFQEFGTSAHGPVKARAMHFFWKGEEIFAKWVRGCTPLRWMSRAVDLSLPLVDMIFQALAMKTGGLITFVTGKKPADVNIPYTVKGPEGK